MNKQIKELTLASMFLALTSILVMIQIPFMPALGLSIDFSYVALLIGRRYIGLVKTLVLCLIFPWMSLLGTGTGSVPGALFLILQAIVIVKLDWLFNRNEYRLGNTFLVIILITIWSIILNIFLIGPMFSGDWSAYYNDLASNAKAWGLIALIFNPFKFLIVYNVIFMVAPRLVEVTND